MEARMWLQQKRLGAKQKVENELDATNLDTPYQVSSSYFFLKWWCCPF